MSRRDAPETPAAYAAADEARAALDDVDRLEAALTAAQVRAQRAVRACLESPEVDRWTIATLAIRIGSGRERVAYFARRGRAGAAQDR